MNDSPIRKLRCIMFTDAVGFSALAQRDEERALELLRLQREMAVPAFEAHGGRVIKSTGDGFFVEFDNALAAARCAVDLQERARERADAGLQMRIGLHLGDVVQEGDDVYGDGVNIASRVEGCAPPGGICVTGAVAHQIENRLERPLLPLGKRRLKNIAKPLALYRIVMPWEDPDALGARGRRWIQRVPRRAAAVAAGLAAVGALAGVWLGGGGASGAAAGEIRSLAVLPLENLSGDPEQQYFADGMTEALINDLAKIGALKVISRTSAMRFKDSDLSATEIAERLEVDAVLEGAVLRSGDRVRITTQLVDGATDRNLWSESYTRDLRDVLALQNEVARDVAERVQVALSPEEARRLAGGRPVDPRAHEEYLRGRDRWRRAPAGTSLPDAIEHFERALELDPSYALAHAGLADAWLVFAHFGERPREALAKAKAAALRALELDPDLSDAHTALADARFHLDWDWERAERGFQRALELNPGNSTARFWYAGLLSAVGRHDEAIEQMDRGKALDPFYPTAHGFAVRVYYWAGRDDLARQAIADLGERFGDEGGALNVYAYLAVDLPPELVSRMAAAGAEGAAAPPVLVTLALERARAGRAEEAGRILSGLEASLGERIPYQIARVHAALGHRDAALDWLERAAEARDAALPWVHVEPLFDPFHDDARYRRLVRRMGLA